MQQNWKTVFAFVSCLQYFWTLQQLMFVWSAHYLSLSASSLIFMCFNEDCYKQVKAVNRCRVKGSSHSLVSFHFCLFVVTQVLHVSTMGFRFIFNIFSVLFTCKFAPVKEIISEPYIFLSVSWSLQWAILFYAYFFQPIHLFLHLSFCLFVSFRRIVHWLIVICTDQVAIHCLKKYGALLIVACPVVRTMEFKFFIRHTLSLSFSFSHYHISYSLYGNAIKYSCHIWCRWKIGKDLKYFRRST